MESFPYRFDEDFDVENMQITCKIHMLSAPKSTVGMSLMLAIH